VNHLKVYRYYQVLWIDLFQTNYTTVYNMYVRMRVTLTYATAYAILQQMTNI